VGPKGKIFAFEPQLKLFRELYMNCALNKLHNTCLMRYAIGSKNKPIMMGNPPVGNEGGVGVSRGGDEADQYTLDSLKLPPFSFIKIDVEGGENQLLDGATKTLLKYKPIILIEIMGGHDVDTACPEIKERIFSTHRKLERLGYTISRVSVQDYLARPK
jgi:FkbM family methyltransferase